MLRRKQPGRTEEAPEWGLVEAVLEPELYLYQPAEGRSQ